MSQYVTVEDPDSLLGVLVSGCDERIFLRPSSQANKYHLNPVEYGDLLQRGSCTCNLLTPDGHKVAEEYLKTYSGRDYGDLVQEQAGRIQGLFQGHTPDTKFDVVFGPSGSDMMYVPLLFQSMFNPGQEIVNIVTCPDELGSGSKPAAEVKYYAAFNQRGGGLEINGMVCKEGEGEGEGEGGVGVVRTKCKYLAARDPVSGSIRNNSSEITKLVGEQLDDSTSSSNHNHNNNNNNNNNNNEEEAAAAVIVNLVFGSKSGIEDDCLALIDSLQAVYGSDPKRLMFCVDMCQFRADVALVHALVARNVMIMITGSKFYQAPPFCGALLVPAATAVALSTCDATAGAAYKEIFSAHDFPSQNLQTIAAQLDPFVNKGLRTRWEVALHEMAAYQAFPNTETNAAIARWRQVVVGRLAQTDTFKLMPNINDTSASIVSFQVLRADGTTLTKPECQTIFDRLALNRHTGLKGGYEKIFIGQPVAFGSTGAFIRLAIGSYGIRTQMQQDRFDAHNDLRVIQVLEDLAQEMYP
jgi:hypothetical protein